MTTSSTVTGFTHHGIATSLRDLTSLEAAVANLVEDAANTTSHVHRMHCLELLRHIGFTGQSAADVVADYVVWRHNDDQASRRESAHGQDDGPEVAACWERADALVASIRAALAVQP